MTPNWPRASQETRGLSFRRLANQRTEGPEVPTPADPSTRRQPMPERTTEMTVKAVLEADLFRLPTGSGLS
jgi:hypothetical protein